MAEDKKIEPLPILYGEEDWSSRLKKYCEIGILSLALVVCGLRSCVLTKKEAYLNAKIAATNKKIEVVNRMHNELNQEHQRFEQTEPTNLEEVLGEYDKCTKANQLLVDFPNEIPGAKSIRKYPTPGAKHCLVHVRQRHLLPGMLKEDINRIKVVQDDIYSIISHLIENKELKQVYTEGIGKWSELQLDILSDKGKEALFEKLGLAYETFETFIEHGEKYTSKENSEEIKKYLEKSHRRVIEDLKQRIEIQATARLAAEGKIKQIHAEKFSSYRVKADRELFLKSGSKPDEAIWGLLRVQANWLYGVYETREDSLLKIISETQDPISVAVYGGAHAWGGRESFSNYFYDLRQGTKDNIAKWNKEHPDKKFSLIEIVPKNYSSELSLLHSEKFNEVLMSLRPVLNHPLYIDLPIEERISNLLLNLKLENSIEYDSCIGAGRERVGYLIKDNKLVGRSVSVNPDNPKEATYDSVHITEKIINPGENPPIVEVADVNFSYYIKKGRDGLPLYFCLPAHKGTQQYEIAMDLLKKHNKEFNTESPEDWIKKGIKAMEPFKD